MSESTNGTQGDIKVMLPRDWESAMLRAQVDLGERTISGYVRSLVQRDLVSRGYLAEAGPEEDSQQ
jgi:hypothetical protein